MLPKETIAAFDHYLLERGLTLDLVVVGGAALGLMGITSRQTRDVDVLVPTLPEVILVAAADFARQQRAAGTFLADDWLNNGPESLADLLPEGWERRLQVAFDGQALRVSVPGRLDLLMTKLFALCDRGSDLKDCLALAPTAEELSRAEAWVAFQDANPDWPAHVRQTLDALRRRLGHGVS